MQRKISREGVTVFHKTATIFVGSTLLLSQAGCANRPVPGNYSKRISTYGIVQKIRCETRDAVAGFLRNAVAREDPKLAETLRNGGEHFQYFFSEKLPELQLGIRRPIERYWKSAIAFDFTFTTQENNNSTAAVNFSDPFSKGLFKLGVSGGNVRERKNIRSFKTNDFLGELLTSIPLDDACRNIKVPKKTFYPITGNIGMKEFVQTFFNLNQSANLSNRTAGTAPALSDTITFTTTISAGVTPVVELGRVGNGFRLLDGNVDLSASRQDKHNLVMSLALSKFDELNGENAPTARLRATKELERQRKIRLEEEFVNRVVLIN